MTRSSHSERLLEFLACLPHYEQVLSENHRLVGAVRITDGARYDLPDDRDVDYLADGRLLASWPGSTGPKLAVRGTVIVELACAACVDYWHSLGDTFDKEQSLRDLMSHMYWKTSDEPWTPMPTPPQRAFYETLAKAGDKLGWELFKEMAKHAVRAYTG